MDQIGRKNFGGWIKVKKALHYRGKIRNVKVGEIWWSSIGENVGVEICGKGKSFIRPVVVIKKIGRYSFWAIPLTSKQHEGNWYASFEFQGNVEFAVVSQIQCMSVSRLQRKMGQLPDDDLKLIYKAFLELAVENLDKKMRPRLTWGRGGYSRKSNSIISLIATKVKNFFTKN